MIQGEKRRGAQDVDEAETQHEQQENKVIRLCLNLISVSSCLSEH